MKLISAYDSTTYEPRKYLIPSAIPASQPMKSQRVRARKHTLNTPLTYKAMLEEQNRHVQQQLVNEQTAANRATALRGFLKANRIDTEDVVGVEMRISYPESCERYIAQMRASGKSQRAITNTLSALNRWKEAVIAYDTAQALDAQKPTPFLTALRSLLEGQVIAQVARTAGVSKDMLMGWLIGKKPRASNAKFIHRIEAHFALQRGYLVSLSGIKERSKRIEPIGGPTKPIEYRTELGKLTRIIYGLKPNFDSPLRAQWQEFLHFKTSASLVLDGLKRSRRGKWRISPCPVTPRTDLNWYVFINIQNGNQVESLEVASARYGWHKASTYLGWLVLDGNSGGENIPVSDAQTMAWLALPDYLERFLDWNKRRMKSRNRGTMQFLAFVATLVRHDVGYLRQKPEMLKTLPERFQGLDWNVACDQAFELTQQLSASYEDEIRISRDSFAPIMPVLQMSQPMDAVADMIQRMRADRPLLNPKAEAIWARDIVLIKILASNPIRRRNLAYLSWRADNTGEVHQREDGSWWLKIHKGRFKNTKGAAGAREYYECQVNPAAWRDIERYVTIHRPRLMRMPTDLFFINSEPGPRKTPDSHLWSDIGKRVEELTRKYLYKCPGVGPHAFRHIVATSILKAPGGDFKTAALVLNDRVATVEKHYAFLTANEGADRMGKLLADSFKRM